MSNMFELDARGILEGTDKSSCNSGGWDYLRHYEHFFREFRDLPINLIEIGVQQGYSLKLWREYFRQATIIGVDINLKCAGLAEDRIVVEIGSQEDPGFLFDLCRRYPPSIIIDDGSHLAHHNIYTFEQMFPSLQPGGLYIVEDLAFHFGKSPSADARTAQNPVDYLLANTRNVVAGQFLQHEDWGTANYLRKHVDSVTYFHSAALIRKTFERRRVSETVELAESILRDRLGFSPGFARLAEFVLRHAGAPDDAERVVRLGLERDSKDLECLRMYGHILWAQKRFKEAAENWTTVAELTDSDHDWRHIATMRENIGDLTGAVQAGNKVIERTPEDHGTYVLLTRVLVRLNSPEEALRVARQGLAHAAGTPDAAFLREQIHALEKPDPS